MPILPVHFFIEKDGLTAITPEKSFGPISSEMFNLTTSFQANGKKAFSICKGVVLIQSNSSSTNKVNLILRPFKQPHPELNIKYFVYRGLRRSDFFTGNLVKDADGSSDFVNKIRDDFASFYSEAYDNQNPPQLIPAPSFTSKFIGFDDDAATAPPANTLISDFFFKESVLVEANGTFTETDNKDFELPMIDVGKWLGNFADGDCGIDVVLNYGDYKHEGFDNAEFVFDLNYAKTANAKITLSGTEIDKKLQREQITQFIDIAAFYGLYVKEGVVKVTDSSGVVATKTGFDIYTELLPPFANKNKWYIYIQSDRTRSYNYYGKYKTSETSSHSLRMANAMPAVTDPVTYLPEVDYKTDGWPLLINTTTSQPVTPTNLLFLDLVTDNNVNTALYGIVGTIINAQQNNFSNADYLRRAPDADGNYSHFTNTIQLSNPATADGKNIAGITMLLYQGVVYSYKAGTTTNEAGNPVDVLATPNFFDDVFDLIKAKPLLQLAADSQFSKMTSQKLNLINHYYNKKQQGISAVQTLVVNDVIATGNEVTPQLQRVTYLTETVNLKGNAVSPAGSVTTDTKTSPSAGGTVAKSKTYSLPDPYYYSLQLFTDSTQTITGLQLKTTDGSEPTKIILGLTKAENDLLKGLITDATKNPRLFLIDLFEDGNELLSPENIKYQKYKAAIVAENATGGLQLYMPTTDIMVYSLDRKYHFSKGYSENMKEQYGIIYSNFKM